MNKSIEKLSGEIGTIEKKHENPGTKEAIWNFKIHWLALRVKWREQSSQWTWKHFNTIFQFKNKKEKRLKVKEHSLRNLKNHFKSYNICVIAIPAGDGK